ncbi:DUF4142 domain-containing protein [Sorangium sp. So ce367]|uniref:DUF4142 domain-containing protein n=1 Tax=Sorangium sp. So ce367 TaxID=3133305 RepID=UPI003F640BAC
MKNSPTTGANRRWSDRPGPSSREPFALPAGGDHLLAHARDHKDGVEEFEEAAKEAKDADVKRFAATGLPLLREHLAMARQAYDKVK